jgi:hypothetical protein
MLPLLLLLAVPGHARDEAGSPAAEAIPETQVMHAFTQPAMEEAEVFEVPERQRHLIMFIMGATLLIFLIVTVTLGVAMALYGKRVFIPHMIFAGFSLTLAIVHSVVAVVWFFPFSSP